MYKYIFSYCFVKIALNVQIHSIFFNKLRVVCGPPIENHKCMKNLLFIIKYKVCRLVEFWCHKNIWMDWRSWVRKGRGLEQHSVKKKKTEKNLGSWHSCNVDVTIIPWRKWQLLPCHKLLIRYFKRCWLGL